VYKPVETIEVRAWGKLVGAVARDPRLGYYAFEYAPAFVKTGIELSPLEMPLREAQQPFIFPDLPELTYKRLPAMLADALPDDFGNSLINAWMAKQRSLGAMEFKPVRGPRTKNTTAIILSKLVESVRRVVHGEIDDDPHAEAALKQILSVGTSAGGARAKAAIAWNPKTNEIRAGQFDVEPGFEHWLLKFDGIGKDNELGESQGYGRIEYAYYLMAMQAGVEMSPCRLLEESGRAHFMTRRFDRDGNNKIHAQTLCGMASNCDDHTKNLSFLLRNGKSWELAPAYDVIYAYNPKGEWTYQHLMSVNGKFNDIRRDDLMVLADRFEIGSANKILAQVGEAVAAWPKFAKQAGVSSDAVDRIGKNQMPKLAAVG
jgi:serine/threonine-protein kinase HipA